MNIMSGMTAMTKKSFFQICMELLMLLQMHVNIFTDVLTVKNIHTGTKLQSV